MPRPPDRGSRPVSVLSIREEQSTPSQPAPCSENEEDWVACHSSIPKLTSQSFHAFCPDGCRTINPGERRRPLNSMFTFFWSKIHKVYLTFINNYWVFQVKVAILKYIESLARQMDPTDFVNSSETRLAVSRIITWTTEPKSSDVRKVCPRELPCSFNGRPFILSMC